MTISLNRGGGGLNGRTYSRTVDNDYLALNGSSTAGNGAFLRLHGKDYEDTPWAGTVLIRTQNNSNAFFDLVLNPDGTLDWSGDIVITKHDPYIKRHVDNDFIGICGGTGWGHGGYIGASGKDRPYSAESAGCVYMVPCDGTNSHWMHLNANGSWTWDGQAVQLTSDQRLKQQISKIDNALLDAWEDVEPVQFKYNVAVNQKGTKARLHTGYVVQQINEACKSHNVDISDYGLYCHEEYPQETEEVEVTQDDGTTKKETRVIREASEHYSLRYTETLVVECAYLRREVSRLKQQNEDLEQRLKMLEQSVK